MIPKPCNTKPTVTVIPAKAGIQCLSTNDAGFPPFDGDPIRGAGMTTMISFLSRNYVILNNIGSR